MEECKYIKIKVTMVSKEFHIITKQFPLNCEEKDIADFLTRDTFIYTDSGVYINSSLIEEFYYKVLD